MLTVTASGLVHSEMVTEQLDMFGDNDVASRDRSKKREETIDIIRQKFGASAIMNGSIISTDIGIHAPKGKRRD